jgi:hypothetical protein
VTFKLHFNKLKGGENKKTLAIQGFSFDDSDWARTSDLHPVKVALSQLSYGIIFC